MVAMELVKQRDASQPDPDLTKRLVAEAGKRGLVLSLCGCAQMSSVFSLP